MGTVHYLYCQYEYCAKRLIDFAFICEETGEYFCSDVCAEREMTERTPKPERVQ